MVNPALFDSLLDGVLILNEQNQVTYVNDALTNLLAIKARQILKKNIQDIQSLHAVAQEVLNLLTGTGESTAYIERSVQIEGTEKSIQASAQKIGSDVLFFIRDTSLEALLHHKYKTELSKKENLIAELDRRVFELEFLRSSAELQAGEGYSIESSSEKVLNLLKVHRVLLYKFDLSKPQNIEVFFDSEKAKIPDPDIVKILLNLANQFQSDRHVALVSDPSRSTVVSWFIGSGSLYNVFIYQYAAAHATEAVKDQNLLHAHSRQSSLLLENDILFKQSITDEKTGLYNPRYLKFRLDQEINRSRRHHHPFSLIIFDIDHFKSVNDKYGHLSGDIVLIQVADILKNNFRNTDMVARYGGEEFVVVCSDTPPGNISLVAERARERVEKAEFKLDNGQTIHITISAGVAHFPGDGNESSELFEVADQCLYEAKRSGRNKVILSSSAKAQTNN